MGATIMNDAASDKFACSTREDIESALDRAFSATEQHHDLSDLGRLVIIDAIRDELSKLGIVGREELTR